MSRSSAQCDDCTVFLVVPMRPLSFLGDFLNSRINLLYLTVRLFQFILMNHSGISNGRAVRHFPPVLQPFLLTCITVLYRAVRPKMSKLYSYADSCTVSSLLYLLAYVWCIKLESHFVSLDANEYSRTRRFGMNAQARASSQVSLYCINNYARCDRRIFCALVGL